MQNRELMKYVDTQRWLINNNLFSDSIKNQLFTFGTLVHPEVRAVELDINAENKLLNYTIYFERPMIETFAKYAKLSKSTSFIGLLRFKRFLKKEGDLNIRNILQGFINDFCGTGWQANVEVRDFVDYSEDVSETRDEVSEESDRSTD
jgi:hypothetical protein